MVNLGREIQKEGKDPDLPGRIPLSKQKWFRRMVDRWIAGQYLEQRPKQEIVCNHLGDCKHREGFHAYEMPTGNGDHIRKSEVYQFIVWNGHVQHLRRN